jgi:hypothetical protein
VVFSGCGPPPDPPIRVYGRMIVLAGVARNGEAYGYLGYCLSTRSSASERIFNRVVLSLQSCSRHRRAVSPNRE